MNYVKTRKGKNHGERERERERERDFTIIMAITIGFSGVLGFLDLNLHPRWKGLSLFIGCIYFDKAAEFSSI